MLYLTSDEDNITVDFPIRLLNPASQEVPVTFQTFVIFDFFSDKACSVQEIIHQIWVAVYKRKALVHDSRASFTLAVPGSP